VCCSVLQCLVQRRTSLLLCLIVSVLQCVAVCCSVLQCVAVSCSVSFNDVPRSYYVSFSDLPRCRNLPHSYSDMPRSHSPTWPTLTISHSTTITTFPFNNYYLTQWLASLLQQFVHINKLPRSDYFSFKRDNLSILDLPRSYNGLYISTTGLARLFKRRATLSIQRLASQHASLWCRIQNEIKGSGSEFFASSCANRFNPTQHEEHAQDERRKRRGGGGWRKKK